MVGLGSTRAVCVIRGPLYAFVCDVVALCAWFLHVCCAVARGVAGSVACWLSFGQIGPHHALEGPLVSLSPLFRAKTA